MAKPPKPASKAKKKYTKGSPLYSRSEVKKALIVAEGNKTRTAEILQVSLVTLYSYLKRWPTLEGVIAELKGKPVGERKLARIDKRYKALGRPPKVLSKSVIEKLAAYHCTVEEIADILGTTPAVIRDRLAKDRQFEKRVRKAWASGRARLRKWQFKLAHDGNPSMLIWLGKQLLGQREPRMEHIPPEDPGAGSSPFEDLQERLETIAGRRAGIDPEPRALAEEDRDRPN